MKADLCVLLGVLLFCRTNAMQAQTGRIRQDFVAGLLRVKFAASPAEKVDPLALLSAAGVKPEFLRNYNEQSNLNGGVDFPILLGVSPPEARQTWCDVVVPFSTERFWKRYLSRRKGVVAVERKLLGALRGSDPLTPMLSVSQDRVNSAEAPLLEFVITAGDLTKAFDVTKAFADDYYGATHTMELLSLGKSVPSRPRYIAVDNLNGKLFPAPPWQRLRITTVLDSKDPNKAVLDLMFVGGGAYGAAPPPAEKFRSFLEDQKLETAFREHVARFGASLRKALSQSGYALQ